MSRRSSNTKDRENGNGILRRAAEAGRAWLSWLLRRLPYWHRGVAKALATSLTRERDRLFLWVPVAMGLGIGFYFALPVEPRVWQALSVFFLTGLGLVFLRRSEAGTRWGSGIALTLLYGVLFVGLGLAAAKVRTLRVDAPVVERQLTAVMVEGRVASMVAGSDGFPRYIIEPSSIDRLGPDRLPKFVRLSYRGKGALVPPGHVVRFRATLMPPPPPAIPHGFDFARQSYFKQIGGVGYILSGLEPVDTRPPLFVGDRLAFWIQDMRGSVGARLKAALSGAQGGVAAALIVGDRSGIPPDVVVALREAGLAHLLAISGLHMGMAGWAIFSLVRVVMAAVPWLALYWPAKKIAAMTGLAGATFYLALSGAPISAQRAYIMLALVFVAVLLDRPAFTLRMVALAAIVILALQPESLLEAGFQMSFSACTVLVAAYEARRHWLRTRGGGSFLFGNGPPASGLHWLFGRGMRYIGGILLTSFLAGLATAPFAAFHFNQMANYGLVGNLLAVPFMGVFVMPFAVLSLLLMPFGFEEAPLAVMAFGIDQVIWVARLVSSSPHSVTVLPSWPVGALAVVTLGGLWVLLWTSRFRLWGFGGIAAGLLLAVSSGPPDLIIGREGKNIAVRTEDGLLDVMKDRRSRYSVETWERRAGLSPEAAAPKGEASAYRCDRLGCVYHLKNGQTLIHVADARAFDEDCRRADILVTNLYVPKTCTDPSLIVGMMEVRDGGAHIVRLLNDGFEVTTSRQVRGNRPWSQSG